MDKVKAWKEKIIIPTYEVGEPEKYPVFLEKRVYQASSGAVYPNPVIEHISDTIVDKEWDVIFIENAYIKIMVLPALGGRIQMAYDKIRKRHFVYYNNVIKPALVGLTGPWISGGIEFNWPQHHRPSTYGPVDSTIEENADGSITVWVSEVERMFRTKGMAGFTLYPDKAYLEIKAQLYNRTPHPQTFLWWANPAVAVNDHYQSVFPPDVHAVFDHGKRDVSEFPIAKGEYYKVDYSPGTDISRYKNIPVPTSYMAITSEYDFVGGFENDSKGGLLHVADHHISPGKKQWTWGNGDFGRAWDRNLTDEDGPYIELMCGVYTDNQPDFSWLQPYEEKSFKQYFMPYYNVGVVKNANKDVLLNLEENNGMAVLKIHVTSTFKNSRVILESENNTFFEKKLDLKPEGVFEEEIDVQKTPYKELIAQVYDGESKNLISWSPKGDAQEGIPEPAKAAKQPKEIETVEQLYLCGLHLEQYRHATYDPTDYYLEALSREPNNVRNNNAMGLWLLRRAQFEKALKYFDAAIETLTRHNPNPYDGEPLFNRGITLKFLGRYKEAYDAFFKSCWNAAWQDAGYFNLAQVDCINGNFDKALELVDKSLIKNWHNHTARHLKVIILRKLGAESQALKLIEDSLKIDQFNFGILFEKYLLSQNQEDLQYFENLLRSNVHNYIEFSLDYAQAGFYKEGIELLSNHTNNVSEVYPMAAYFMGWYFEKDGDYQSAKQWYKNAAQLNIDYCFPNRLEEVIILNAALKVNPGDAVADYLLGNFWYAFRQYDNAKKCWEYSIKNDNSNAICYRNLALLYYNKTNQKKLAKEYLEEAFELDNTNARVLMELDQLYKKINISPELRLKKLENYEALSNSRDDLYLEKIALYNFLGENSRALSLIKRRNFHPWEGGEGKVPFHYVTANVEIAKKLILEKKYSEAIEYLIATKTYPSNLGEGKLFGTQENDVDFWLGYAYELLGEISASQKYFQKASDGLSDPSPATFYNDQQPDKIFYQGLALAKLSRIHEAQEYFNNLITYGLEHNGDNVKLDYFAISLPDLLIFENDLNNKNKLHCHYLTGLGFLGLKEFEKAEIEFTTVLGYDKSNIRAKVHLDLCQNNFF